MGVSFISAMRPDRAATACTGKLTDLGQLRMCQRYRHLMAAGKPKVMASTAIAREMAGFIWAIARTVTPAST
jgi:hypothetical protein